MDWLIIIGLAGWVWWQSRRIAALSRRVSDLELTLTASAKPAVVSDAVQSATAPTSPPPRDAHAEEPLLLDTPVPEASNDQLTAPVAPPPATEASPPLVLTEVAQPDAAPLLLTEIVPPEPPPKRERKFEQWFAENALAWVAAAALALGGIYLVSYATQQNWFTPGVRLICAIVLGTALIGASEWVRRGARNNLVAALLAGAGAATFYASAWAAHGLYHYVNSPIAALLLTLCAAILVGLAFIHGEALGILAIVAAFLAPPLTSLVLWPPVAVTLYVASIGIAGFALSALRRWAWVSAATLAGLYFWFAAAIEMNDIPRALTMISIASVGGVALSLRGALADEPKSTLPWRQARRLWPTAAICIGSVLLLWAWVAVAPSISGRVSGPAWIAAFHVALAAYAVRARVAAPPALAVAISALVLGFAIYLSARTHVGPLGADLYPTILFAAFTVTASALAARPHRTARGVTAGAGSIGAALLTFLAASTRTEWHSLSAWAPLLSGAILLFAAAWRASRDIAEPHKDRAVDLWTAGGAALVFIGIESGFPAEARTVADAVASLAFANAFTRVNWRMLRFATLTAAGIALAHALSPDLIDAPLTGALLLWRALLYLGAAATALYAASRTVGASTTHNNTAEILSSASLLVVLTGAFLTLRWIATGGAGGHLDDFTETALRALTLVAAGQLALPRGGAVRGEIARWRGHVLMGLGLLYAFLALGLTENPWWGGIPARIDGPPLLDGLLLAFAAPAALAFPASARLYDTQRTAARFYASAGGVFLVLWAILAVRRGFHALDMPTAPLGVFEAACYALIVLLLALLIAALPRLRVQDEARPFTRDLSLITDLSAWTAFAFAVIVMLVARHPWWGAQDALTTNTQSAGLAVMAQAWAATLALGLGRALSLKPGVDATRFAAAATAAMFALSFAHAAVRWLYHGGGMDEREPFMALEGFAHALTPLVFMLAASEITDRLPGRQNVRAYLFDLEAIWSVAIWPALLFAAIGLWFAFNPWWGVQPVIAHTPLQLGLAVGAYPFAAGLSLLARRVPNMMFPKLVAPAIVLLITGHLLVGLTLVVRVIFHGLDIATAATSDVEMWSYSAAWVVFGAMTVGIGTWRNDPVLRWSGLAILCITALKVFFIDAARLSGIIRALSFLGFGVVVTLVAIGSRRFRSGDVAKTIPSPRRDRRVRR